MSFEKRGCFLICFACLWIWHAVAMNGVISTALISAFPGIHGELALCIVAGNLRGWSNKWSRSKIALHAGFPRFVWKIGFLRQHIMKEMLQWLMVWHEHKCIPSLWDTDPEYWWHQGRDDSSWYCSDSSCRVPVFWSREHMACPFNTFPTIQTGQDHSTNGSFLNGRRHLEENVENALLLQGCDLGCPWKDNPLLTEQRFNVTVTTGNSTEA